MANRGISSQVHSRCAQDYKPLSVYGRRKMKCEDTTWTNSALRGSALSRALGQDLQRKCSWLHNATSRNGESLSSGFTGYLSTNGDYLLNSLHSSASSRRLADCMLYIPVSSEQTTLNNTPVSSAELKSSVLRQEKRLLRQLRERADEEGDLLVQAVRSGHERRVCLLLDGGVQPNIQNKEGVTPLIAAVHLDDDPNLQERLMTSLLQKGADPNGGDGDGKTPLIHAAERNAQRAAAVLLKHGSDPSLQDDAGSSALMVATSLGHHELVLLVLAAFRNLHHLTFLSQRNNQGFTAAELALRNGHDEVFFLLKVEEGCVPRPSGPSAFIPTPCDLSRTPTPTEDLELVDFLSLDEETSDDGIASPRKGTFDFVESTPHLSGRSRELTSLARSPMLPFFSPESGNEADTESLMDADHHLEKSNDRRHAKKRSHQFEFSTNGSSAFSPGSNSSPVQMEEKNQATVQKHSDKARVPKTIPPLSDHSKYSDSSSDCGESGSKMLNPLRRITVASSAHLTPSKNKEAALIQKLLGSTQSLNRSVRSLVHDELDSRPGHRPPTPARPSLPTLMPGTSLEGSFSSTCSDGLRYRKATNAGVIRSTSEPQTLKLLSSNPFRNTENESDHTDTEGKLEHWNQSGINKTKNTFIYPASHAVHLPPIEQNRVRGMPRTSSQDETVLSIVKHTVDKLDVVLGFDEVSQRRHLTRAKTLQHFSSSRSTSDQSDT